MPALFKDETEVEETIVIDPNDPLAAFKAKYTDEAGIAKALVTKEGYIKRLERENAEARVEIAARANVEDVVDRLIKSKPANPLIPPVETNPPGQQNGSQPPTSTQGLTAEDVEKLLAQREQEATAKANQKYTVERLTERYGKDYISVVQAKAKEIGESMDFFEALAQTRPAVLLNLLGPAPAQAPATFKPQTVNTTSTVLGTQQNSGRTHKYYENLKKTNPTEYFKPKTQNMMYQDSMKLGEAFFDV